jgi:hypothetical protein
MARLRNGRGGQLIEVTCASLMLALFTCAIFDTMSAQSRLATMAKYQLFATTVAQTAVDCARSLPFDDLVKHAGTHNLEIQADNGKSAAPNVVPRPVWQDRLSVKYSDDTAINNFYRDHAKVVEQIDLVNPNLARVTLNITWSEHSRERNLKLSTLISRYGLHG